ncbi:MAG: trigger factor [Gammaproteobacteria bacterium]|nr:trigger factor [Gammaproteobacteria bacterium]MCW5583841.1 trigger factor [Gammaproteobacteria bacterium]
MQVSVEEVSNIKRRLTIVVPVDQVEEAYIKQINRFAKNANIKGFRPGKAPLAYIQQRFGSDARKEALSDVIQKTLYEALNEQKLTPVSPPQVEPKVITPNQPLEFVASFEILPNIEKIQFSMETVEKLNVEVSLEDIKRVIDQLLKQYTKWTIVDRPAKEQDRVVIDYHAIFEGQADLENKVQNFPLEIGSKHMLPGFEDGLLGAKAGDERTLNLIFPADFSIKEKAGKPVDFIIHIKQIFEAETPELDSKFIQKLGVKSGKEEDLTQQIRQSLDHERNRLVKEKLKEQVFRALLEQNPLDVPGSLIAREAKNIHDEIYPQDQHHDHHQHSDDELSAFSDIAKKRVALGLLIAEYAKQVDLKIDVTRVSARIQEIASAYEKPQDVIEWLSSDERRASIEAQVMEEQVLDKLIENIPVTEKIMSYAELKGIPL